jgi:hypothetical protein
MSFALRTPLKSAVFAILLGCFKLLDQAAVGLYHEHSFILVDDMLRVLTAVKKAGGHGVTTLFARQGKFAHDPAVIAANRQLM